MRGAVSLCEAPQEHNSSAQYSCVRSIRTYLSAMYVLGLESPSHFFWDEKCYSQDRSDRSGSGGPDDTKCYIDMQKTLAIQVLCIATTSWGKAIIEASEETPHSTASI